MRTLFLKFLIIRAVPFLNLFRKTPKWEHSIQELRNLPEGSIGNDLAMFLDGQNLALLPKYEVHDLLHVFLDYGTTPFEEMKLQGFMVGNKSSTFGGKVLFVIGLIIKPEYFKAVRKEYVRGMKATLIRSIDFNRVVTRETHLLRAEINVPSAC